ncbi:MAG: hypothetical protein LBD24_05940, partial [Spirochaetaceae bacterium]|nr:hypothetical protein [Spirochaetaceae bacterium]
RFLKKRARAVPALPRYRDAYEAVGDGLPRYRDAYEAVGDGLPRYRDAYEAVGDGLPRYRDAFGREKRAGRQGEERIIPGGARLERDPGPIPRKSLEARGI